MSSNDYFQKLLERFQRIPYIRPSMLPQIDLYMDQVTTFMEERLGSWRRYPDEKILTKTMINNYTKNKLLPPPVRKKYSSNHLLLLNYIYYLKNILSINDINTLMKPITERYWDPDAELNMRSIYRRVLTLEHQMYRDSQEDIARKTELARHAFEEDKNISAEERDYLRKFVFITLLSFDVSLKKRMIESIIDDMNEN